MAGATAQEITQNNAALAKRRQGDFFVAENLFFIHLADLTQPLSAESLEIASERVSAGESLEVEGVASAVPGYVVVTQTCDLVRDCKKRSLVELCPLVEVEETVLNEIRLLRRPAFAFIPGGAEKRLVADLDRIITVEKAVLRHCDFVCGCRDDPERRAFSDALARHRNRPALPTDFNECMGAIKDHLKKIHRSNDAEGLLIRSIGEIRVTASPSWAAEKPHIFFWFFLRADEAPPTTDLSQYIDNWLALFSPSAKYDVEGVVCRLEEMKASEYVGSDRMDLDQLSVP